MVLLEIEITGIVDSKRDYFKFIGLGFGGNILLYFCKFIYFSHIV